MIYINKLKVLEGEVKQRHRVSGHYKLVKRKAETGHVVQVAEFDNLITDAGLNAWGGSPVGNRMYIGSGTNAPSVLDTALGNQVALSWTSPGGSANLNISQSSPTAPDYYCDQVLAARFPAGVGTGNLSEVGLGYNISDSTSAPPTVLFSRALILDGAGNPVTITKLADEILDVYYTLRCYFDVEDSGYTINITGSGSHDVVQRPSSINFARVSVGAAISATNAGGRFFYAYNSSQALQPISVHMANVGGYQAMSISYTQDAYTTPLTKTGSGTAAIGGGNFVGGIGLVGTYDPGAGGGIAIMMQRKFTPPIPKDNTKTLKLNSSVSWGRY